MLNIGNVIPEVIPEIATVGNMRMMSGTFWGAIEVVWHRGNGVVYEIPDSFTAMAGTSLFDKSRFGRMTRVFHNPFRCGASCSLGVLKRDGFSGEHVIFVHVLHGRLDHCNKVRSVILVVCFYCKH